MGRRDNAVADRCLGTMRRDLTEFVIDKHFDKAKVSMFKQIETFYNSVPPHQMLTDQSPDQFEGEQEMPITA